MSEAKGEDVRTTEDIHAASISLHPSEVEKAVDHHSIPLDEDPEFSYAEQRKIIHRVDKRLVVMTGLMYCVSLMDRSNLPNAAIAGMRSELELSVGTRYVSGIYGRLFGSFQYGVEPGERSREFIPFAEHLVLICIQSTLALVFFVTYTIFQPPATVFIRWIGPRPFLAGLCVSWGFVMMGFGLSLIHI